MSSLWEPANLDSGKSTYDSIFQTDHDENYDSDISSNDNISNTTSLNNVAESSHSSLSQDVNKQHNIEPLYPEKIRWFYKENKLWVPFCGYDSLRLETKYRELINQHKLSKESIIEKIVVRGDLFEVDVLKRLGFPIYWNAIDEGQESFPILRGTWFRETTWQPLDSEEISEEIEACHQKLFGLNTCCELINTDGFAQHLSNKFHLNMKSFVIGGYHIDWFNQDTVFLYTDSASRFIRHKLGLTKVGCKLNRGYKNKARIDDKFPDITHLVFVIHGIGQKMKGGDIASQVSKIRGVSRKVSKKFFPFLEEANQRVEFLPVEWRKSLILDGDTVELITPTRNKGLRSVMNSTVLDILYYSSPIYRPEMIGSLRSELNRLYSMFCARSPYFEGKGGKVSVIAHSLGAVLIYDILTNWSPAKIYEYLETLDSDQKDKSNHTDQIELFSELNSAKEKVHHLELLALCKGEKENAKRSQTNFRTANFPSNFIDGTLWKVLPKIENLFCVGSPLSVFLALRGLKPEDRTSINHILPVDLCERFFNIFHPADPVVYRMEPLINKLYANVEPLRIYRLDHPKKLSYDSHEISYIKELENNQISYDTLTEKSIQDEITQRYMSENVNVSPVKVNFTLAGKLMKFINKFKAEATMKMTNNVVNQVMPNQEITLFDDNSDHSSKGSKKKSKKVRNKIFSQTSVIDQQINNVEFFNPGQKCLSKYTSFRRSRRPTWTDSPEFSHKQSLRRLSEIQMKSKLNYYVNSCNSDQNYKSRTKYPSEESSDEETVKSSDDETTPDFCKHADNLPSPSNSILPVNLIIPRIDFKLPESRYESSYLSVLTSHFNYWTSPELCMFVLTQIFAHLGEIGKPR